MMWEPCTVSPTFMVTALSYLSINMFSTYILYEVMRTKVYFSWTLLHLVLPVFTVTSCLPVHFYPGKYSAAFDLRWRRGQNIKACRSTVHQLSKSQKPRLGTWEVFPRSRLASVTFYFRCGILREGNSNDKEEIWGAAPKGENLILQWRNWERI